MSSEANKEVAAAIQAVEEGVGAVAGAGDDLKGPEDQGGPGGPDCQNEPGSPQGQDCPSGPSGPSSHCAPGSPDGQGGAGAQGKEGDPGVADNQADPGARADQDGAGARDLPGGLGVPDDQAGSGAGDHPRGRDAQYEQAGHRDQGSPGVEEGVGPAAVGAADVAQTPRASGPGGDAAPEAIGPRERPIVFRWIAEDPGPLTDSVNSFFQRLFLVIRNIQHSRPRFSRRHGRRAVP